MEIIRAENSGFCFGVKKAIETTEQQIREKKDRKIYTCGPLIHNTLVIEQLSEKGVGIINSPEEAGEGDVVIVRSHGEPKNFYDKARQKNIEIVDATCPFVERIHQLVYRAYSEGKNILIIGDSAHPEVIGINGWCNNEAVIIDTPCDTEKVKTDSVYIVCQTTIKRQLLDDITCRLEKQGIAMEINNTICNATRIRQESTAKLAQEVDAMVVIGSHNSSNTKKLYEIAKKYCDNSHFIENIQDLPLKELQKCNKIGVAAGASTPECSIKEVIANMSEMITSEKNLMEDFLDEIDASLRLPRTGEIVNGKVHQVTEKEVIVNMGCKKDGILPAEEVTLEEGQKLTDLFNEGDEIQAKVIKTDDGDGGILLSKKKLEINEHWNEINEALENKTNLSVKVIRQVNGGVIAAYKEVTGFIPLSQLSDKYVESADEFMGQTMDIRVTRVDQRRNRAVFSHKAVLADERQQKISAIWEGLNVDDIVEGTVMRFTDYGAFIDLGGIDGLLHISEISWGKLKHPQEVLAIGDTVKVKILSMNEEKGKIALGLKQTVPEPWSVIDDNFEVGQVVSGKVVQIKEYGAFIELEPGLDGLVHISEVAHKRVTNIADELTIGQEVNAKILEIDKERKRISLSIKATVEPEAAEEEPAEDAE